MAKKIYVGRLSYSTTDEMLYKHFSQVGNVQSAKVGKSMNPQTNSGNGYVMMSNDKETEKAITELNNSILDGICIRVVEAHPIDQERKPYYYKRR